MLPEAPSLTRNIPIDEINAELDKLVVARPGTLRNAALFALSILLFIGVGLLKASWESLAIIVFVLLFHESGHWLGMKILGYRDVRMFFIPFFGAAVAGQPSNASGTSRAIVSLLGPVPGIALGIIGLVFYVKTKQPLFLPVSGTCLFLNAFNLLPIFPLDGGQFMESVLFSRHPTLAFIFKVLAGIALSVLALLLHSVVLGIVALITLIVSREAYFQGRIICYLRGIKNNEKPSFAGRIPREYLDAILPELSAGLPKQGVKAKTLASRAQSIWLKFSTIPPRLGISLALLAVYLVVLLAGIGGSVAVYASRERREIDKRTMDDGKTVFVEVRYFDNTKLSETQLNEQGLYNGTEIAWNTKGIKVKEGSWVDGYWDGEWKFYDSGGALHSVQVYEMGQLTKYSTVQNGELVEIPPGQWPFLLKHQLPKKPQGTHLKYR